MNWSRRTEAQILDDCENFRLVDFTVAGSIVTANEAPGWGCLEGGSDAEMWDLSGMPIVDVGYGHNRKGGGFYFIRTVL